MHRIHPNIQMAVFDSLDAMWHGDAAYWNDHLEHLDTHTILSPSPGALSVGAGAPPIPTADGLVLFFHERRGDGSYTVNVALLDAATGRMISKLPDPLLEPELPWERAGDVDNVVFVQGAHRREDGVIYFTYGAADRCVGAAVVHGGSAAGRAPRRSLTDVRPSFHDRRVLHRGDERDRRLGPLVLVDPRRLETVEAPARLRIEHRDPHVVQPVEPSGARVGAARARHRRA